MLVVFPVAKCSDISSSLGRSYTTETDGTNTIAKFTCDIGYTLDGTASVTCDTNGDWTPSLPTCGKYVVQTRFLILLILKDCFNNYLTHHVF